MEDAGMIAGWIAPGREQTAADEEGFRRLYEATSRPLWGYLQHVCGRPDAADDLLQETYCKFLLSKVPAMDEARTRSYLFRIATNLLHNRFRSREDAALEEPAECGVETDQAARLDVQAAMRRLKPRERELLWLAYVEGMSHAEIAAATGLGAMSIRILLYRARRKASGILRPQRTKS
ncbi:MAG: sigma-70 family RNA polymerase sigma factor [Terracidiphilus sp.]|jgi:RNA polymerase sigma-70 factor (ECF subfamily)